MSVIGLILIAECLRVSVLLGLTELLKSCSLILLTSHCCMVWQAVPRVPLANIYWKHVQKVTRLMMTTKLNAIGWRFSILKGKRSSPLMFGLELEPLLTFQ